MTYKKRILFVGEASFLSTGFSTYYRDLLPRLVATGKYEIAEVGSYARQDDPRVHEFIRGRWKFYGVMPRTQQELAAFNQPSANPKDRGQNINQFGANVFDVAVADFKPDIVIDIRDNWMLNWQLRSVFRPWFKLIWMPTVDAEPQHEDWIKDYEQADLILSYSDYGVNALMRQSPAMRVFPKPMRPGVDLSTFFPADQASIRDKYMLRNDLPVIGTVMRNQSRKLYPDLIDAFAHMKNKYAETSEIAKRAVLLLHSSWPDNAFSYDYPRHIMRLHSYPWMPYHRKGIKDDVLQTLMCINEKCGKLSVGHAMTLYDKPVQNGRIMQYCKFCHQMSAICPSSGGHGYTREGLAEVYNLLDLYVQCSICEGDGMPIQEAKACGVPTLVMDYTAMREKGRYPNYKHFSKLGINESNYSCHKGGEVIKTGRYYYEPETSCMRATPDIDDLADKMFKFLTDKDYASQSKLDARACVEQNYDWDKLITQWEFVLDKVNVKDRSKTWDTPIVLTEVEIPSQIPAGLDNDQFMEWLYVSVLRYPRVDPEGVKYWLDQISIGATREQLFAQFKAIAQQGENGVHIREKIRAAVNPSAVATKPATDSRNEKEWV